MKTLYVTPTQGYDVVYHLLDIKSGEVLATHFCSHEGFAKDDLFGRRQEKYKELYQDDVEVKFFNEQDEITEDQFAILNKEWAINEGLIDVDGNPIEKGQKAERKAFEAN